MIDALLWVGGVAVGLTFGYGIGRRRLDIDDQRVAETIANLRHDLYERETQQDRLYRRLSHQSDIIAELRDDVVAAKHRDIGRYGRYRTAKGVELRVAVLAVAKHGDSEYAIIVPTDLAGASPYSVRYDAVTLETEQ